MRSIILTLAALSITVHPAVAWADDYAMIARYPAKACATLVSTGVVPGSFGPSFKTCIVTCRDAAGEERIFSADMPYVFDRKMPKEIDFVAEDREDLVVELPDRLLPEFP
ncbi:hypothetical protein LAZ40_05505 [Cereibacter sphaeroides]|uniref:hypothetical protein n=1 Tax=Cereibacter sphaeroides TaxID=1063 RepID=UPI001F297D18|nr:hypothetical protein [Cereibacter sphaeroides]MCE6958505.1 hypothetical protein [Cereibacter sphaeroides]MCE6972833.1 hypothetical protein [Cereibacter sphaeroides]